MQGLRDDANEQPDCVKSRQRKLAGTKRKTKTARHKRQIRKIRTKRRMEES